MAATAHALHILVKHKEIAEDIIKQLGKGAKFDFSVTAEGIECDEHLQYLKKHHCDIAQGYYLSHPIEKNGPAI